MQTNERVKVTGSYRICRAIYHNGSYLVLSGTIQ